MLTCLEAVDFPSIQNIGAAASQLPKYLKVEGYTSEVQSLIARVAAELMDNLDKMDGRVLSNTMWGLCGARHTFSSSTLVKVAN